jgi:hypothetical protein
MSEEPKVTMFDQRDQHVEHQTNIGGGDNQTNIIQEGMNWKQASELFSAAINVVEKSSLSSEKKKELDESIHTIQKEVAKGENANQTIFQSLFNSVIQQIPEIAEVLLTAILDPVSGATSAVKLLAKNVVSGIKSRMHSNSDSA